MVGGDGKYKMEYETIQQSHVSTENFPSLGYTIHSGVCARSYDHTITKNVMQNPTCQPQSTVLLERVRVRQPQDIVPVVTISIQGSQ